MFNWKKSASAFCQHAFGNKVETLAVLPRVLVSRAAYNRMWHIVDIADKEVGWLGTVQKIKQDFLIEEVFLFKQEVASTTCEISAEGLAEVAMELMSSRPDGMDVCNRLCFWGHSHVNMGTSPSGQDESQMQTFRESGHSFFIRGIFNKNGRMEFTIFLYESGVKIVDTEWTIYEPVDDSLRAEIEAEFKAKVSEKIYPVAPTPGSFGGMFQHNYEESCVGTVGLTGKRTKGGRKW
jgi:hypothetical protein